MTLISTMAHALIQQQQQRNTPFRIKRSLCNTFGGCGAKRSIQPDRLYIGGRNGIDPATDKEAFFSHKKEPNAVLIAEILNDLLEYMQANEGNKRGKHVFMVADHPSESKVSYGIPPQAASNEGDLQEAQVIYPRVSE